MKKNYKKLFKKNLGQKKQLKEKMINYMLNGKFMIIHLIVGLIKKIQCDSIGCNYIKMSKYFPKPYEPFGGEINV